VCAETGCSLKIRDSRVGTNDKTAVYTISQYPGAEVVVSGKDGTVATGIFPAMPNYAGEQQKFLHELDTYYLDFIEFSERLMGEFLPAPCPKASELLRALAGGPLHPDDDTPCVRCGSQRVSVGTRDGHAMIIFRR
jgi:hypothetical protein